MNTGANELYFTVDEAKLRELAVEMGPYGLRDNGPQLIRKAMSAITLRNSQVAQADWEYLTEHAYLPCMLEPAELDRLEEILKEADDYEETIQDIAGLLRKHLPPLD